MKVYSDFCFVSDMRLHLTNTLKDALHSSENLAKITNDVTIKDWLDAITLYKHFRSKFQKTKSYFVDSYSYPYREFSFQHQMIYK